MQNLINMLGTDFTEAHPTLRHLDLKLGQPVPGSQLPYFNSPAWLLDASNCIASIARCCIEPLGDITTLESLRCGLPMMSKGHRHHIHTCLRVIVKGTSNTTSCAIYRCSLGYPIQLAFCITTQPSALLQLPASRWRQFCVHSVALCISNCPFRAQRVTQRHHHHRYRLLYRLQHGTPQAWPMCALQTVGHLRPSHPICHVYVPVRVCDGAAVSGSELEAWTKLSGLTELGLYHSAHVTFTHLKQLSALKSLRRLSFSTTRSTALAFDWADLDHVQDLELGWVLRLPGFGVWSLVCAGLKRFPCNRFDSENRTVPPKGALHNIGWLLGDGCEHRCLHCYIRVSNELLLFVRNG